MDMMIFGTVLRLIQKAEAEVEGFDEIVLIYIMWKESHRWHTMNGANGLPLSEILRERDGRGRTILGRGACVVDSN